MGIKLSKVNLIIGAVILQLIYIATAVGVGSLASYFIARASARSVYKDISKQLNLQKMLKQVMESEETKQIVKKFIITVISDPEVSKQAKDAAVSFLLSLLEDEKLKQKVDTFIESNPLLKSLLKPQKK
ncbi:MAG: hypothetical protein JZD40_00205 [Sulfolobus sp.]|nr:hypothetical protein [Sulfolobus sp.]